MKTRQIGARAVGEIGIGGYPLSCDDRPDEAQAIATIHAALDAGITLIDTADAYSRGSDDFGHNELLVRRALDAYGPGADDVLIATKGGHTRPGGAVWDLDCSPEHLKQACRESLRRLRVEAIDLYQLHWPDPKVPYAESIGALRDLLDEGLIRMAGISNADEEQIGIALDVLDGRLSAVQNDLSVLVRGTEPEVALCESLGIAFLAYAPLGGFDRTDMAAHRHPAAIALGERYGVSPQQVALAWLLALAPNVIPIPGSRRPETIRDSAAASELRLTPEDMALFDSA